MCCSKYSQNYLLTWWIIISNKQCQTWSMLWSLRPVYTFIESFSAGHESWSLAVIMFVSQCTSGCDSSGDWRYSSLISRRGHQFMSSAEQGYWFNENMDGVNWTSLCHVTSSNLSLIQEVTVREGRKKMMAFRKTQSSAGINNGGMWFELLNPADGEYCDMWKWSKHLTLRWFWIPKKCWWSQPRGYS